MHPAYRVELSCPFELLGAELPTARRAPDGQPRRDDAQPTHGLSPEVRSAPSHGPTRYCLSSGRAHRASQPWPLTGRLDRARDRESLEPLIARTGAEVNPWEGSDYAFRIVMPRTEFTAWVSEQADAIDYTNFKSSAHKRRGGAFADVLHDVWGAMYRFQGRVDPERG